MDRIALANVAAIIALLAADPAAAQTAPDQKTTALHCPQLIDTDAGKLAGETTIVIQGQRIKDVLPGRQTVEGATDVDLTGSVCLPGLIDGHVHITGERRQGGLLDRFTLNPADVALRATVFAKRTLLAGFTTVRSLGDSGESYALRNAINAGWVVGPRIFTAGKPIGTTGGHADNTDGLRKDLQGDAGPKDGIINSPEEAWQAVRQHYKDGADLIKIMASGGVVDQSSSVDNPQMTIEEIRAVVAAAHDYGFAVAVHAHGAESIRRAVEGGVDSIEHGTFMNDDDIKLLKQHGTWYEPTIFAAIDATEKAKTSNFYTPQQAAKAALVGPQILNTVSRAYKGGVRFSFGTDAGNFPHGQNANDFPYLVQAGFTPIAAIQTATKNAAELLRQSQNIGSIASGKFADIIAVDTNPLDDINALKQVSFVMKEGAIYKEHGKEITP